MNGKPSIAILHYAGPPLVGGVEHTIEMHARLLAGRGYPVRVIAGRVGEFDPSVRVISIPEVDSRYERVIAVGKCLAAGQVPPEFGRLTSEIASRLRKALDGVEICIVHNATTLHKNLPLTAALHRLASEGVMRFIAWCHDFAWLDPLYTPDLHPGYPWDLLREPWPGVEYVVVSQDRREMLADLFGWPSERITVIPPGIDPGHILGLSPEGRRLVEDIGLWDADPAILLPARITRRKNIELGIRITAALVELDRRPVMVVTGPPGPHNPTNTAYLHSLQELRDSLGVAESVVFLYERGGAGEPFVPDETLMADLYRSADILLFPSKREGFGIPILEAGVVRMPIFCSDIPPFRESGDGLIHTFGLDESPEEIARRIDAYLSEDEVYRMRKQILRHYTWGRILGKRILPLIERLMER